ncbi:MAG TPA: beta-ketoacyl synthase chain length factor [Steroidobacteraceae bacterium]|nr:beta-ketoacyl synthase chain length factor [Steroidobacteraceae bacterium]
MTPLTGYVQGVGLVGPGLPSWAQGAARLAGAAPWEWAATVMPQPQCLPPAERRRTPASVRLALGVGLEATANAGADAAQLAAVFSSSSGDGQNCHEICEALATGERLISPTRFHNSVHNAAAGYWGIATGATAAANALCAYDASFGAALLEALTQVRTEGVPVLLVAYDTVHPEPLWRVRGLPEAFGVALVLAPEAGAAPRARLAVGFSEAPATPMSEPRLEALRAGVPAARSLPLLARLARGGDARVVLEYLKPPQLAVEVSACP